MAKKTAPLLPATAALLHQLGERLRMARLRRQLTARQVAERSGMAPMTLRSLERGAPGVTMGAYLSVMQVLGLEQDLAGIGQADSMGRELQDARLAPASRRSPTTAPPTTGGTSPQAAAPPEPTPARQAAEPPAPDWVSEGGFADASALASLLVPPLRTP